MAWIEIKTKDDVLPILEDYKEYRMEMRSEIKELEKELEEDSNYAFNRTNRLNSNTFRLNKMSGFLKSNKIDALLEKGFTLKFNGVILNIDTNNDFWGDFNYYPKSGKMYAKNWKMWYENSWFWIQKKLINNDRL